MKKTLLAFTAIALILTSGCATAHHTGPKVYGTVTSVTENWVWEEVRVPFEQCTTVRVPSTRYRSNGNSSGDALSGMIIGGILGKSINGNSNDAAVGAILGGLLANNNHNHGRVVQHNSYREERRCMTQYETKRDMVQVGYSVDYMYEGYLYTMKTFKSLRIGDKIPLNVSVSPTN